MPAVTHRASRITHHPSRFLALFLLLLTFLTLFLFLMPLLARLVNLLGSGPLLARFGSRRGRAVVMRSSGFFGSSSPSRIVTWPRLAVWVFPLTRSSFVIALPI